MIAIIDYGAGNLMSVKLGFEALGISVTVTNVPATILSAEHVVFPGVGAIGMAMKRLAQLQLVDALMAVVDRGIPFLGICLGAQIIFEHSEEDGGVDGIGLMPGVVRLFRSSDPLVKVPQMGWNNVEIVREHPLFHGIDNGSEFYFVHSYYPATSNKTYVLGETEYAGMRFASVVGKDNLIATQFHPERSGRIGLRFLENFGEWDGTVQRSEVRGQRLRRCETIWSEGSEC